MPNYRRRFSPGGTFFFSVMLERDAPACLIRSLPLLRAVYAETLASSPFETLAIVILPDHLHAIWRLPEGDANYPLRWRKIKARFSYLLNAETERRPSHRARAERGLWQRRYWEHQIRDKADLQTHMAYCWSDPVRHGLAATPQDWEASSIHRDIRHGRVSEDWSCGQIAGHFGERAMPQPA